MKDYTGCSLARFARLLFALLMVASLTLMAMPAHPTAAQTPTPAPPTATPIPPTPVPPTPVPQNPFDLMLVIDGSSSITDPDFELAREFARTLINSCLFVTGSRAGVVQYSSGVQLEHGLSDNRTSLDSALVFMRQINSRTATGEAINLAQQELTKHKRPNVKNFIIVLTDGYSNEGVNPVTAANNARAAGSELFAIGVSSDVKFPELQGIANDPDAEHIFQVTDFASLQSVLTPVVGAVCGVPVVPIVPSADKIEHNPAEIYVVQRPTANHTTTPGSIVTSQIVVGNTGRGGAKDVTLTMPFNPKAVRVLNAKFTSPTAWVSNLGADTLTIKTGYLGSSQKITATLQLQVLNTVSPNTSLAGQLTFSWIDNASGGKGKSNTTILTVAKATDDRPTYALGVQPAAAAAGTRFSFSSNLFAPKEPVGVWYNLPNGTTQSVGTFYANTDGMMTVNFNAPGNLAAGGYNMIFYGHWTEFTAVAPFTIVP